MPAPKAKERAKENTKGRQGVAGLTKSGTTRKGKKALHFRNPPYLRQ